MPSYTIMIMRRDATDKRPLTLHISGLVFWSVIALGILLPVAGFMISFGWVAPTWLQLNVDQMEAEVENAQQAQAATADLMSDKQKLEDQLKSERTSRAEAEARVTMAETARVEANSRMGELEGELVNLKRSLATYERMLKPKLQRELVQCTDVSVSYAGGKVTYNAMMAKTNSKGILPPNLVARVSVLAGNNAVALADAESKGGKQVNVPIDLKKSQNLKGTMDATLPGQTTHVLDIKIMDATQVVGYCWKSF